MYNTDVEKSNRRTIGIDESKYICCCGCHVISCARFFLIVSIVVSAITLLSLFSCYYLSKDDFIIQFIGNASWIEPENFNHFIYKAYYYSLVICGCDIAINAATLYVIYRIKHAAGVLYENNRTKPDALSPYIMLKIVLFIMSDFYIIILAIMFFTDNGLVLFWKTVGAFVLGQIFIGCLLVHIFYRANNYLKEVELGKYATVDQNDL